MSGRVLLVDDEPAIRLIARAALLRAGFTVLVAGDGASALAIAAVDPPDLILLDWMLPDLDGFTVCARLKADPRTARVPVVFLTAKAAPDVELRCRGLGARGWIAKPFNPFELGTRVRAFCNGEHPPEQAT
jgi:DNA-binding response OmpR family regulator